MRLRIVRRNSLLRNAFYVNLARGQRMGMKSRRDLSRSTIGTRAVAGVLPATKV